MLNYKVILFVLGQLLFLEAIMLAACCGVGFIYHESTLIDFGIPMFICVSLGLLFHFLGGSKNQGMGRRDAFLIVSTTWLLFSIIGMLPFLLSGIVTRPSVAFFETMSGFTTTGATALRHRCTAPLYFILAQPHPLGRRYGNCLLHNRNYAQRRCRRTEDVHSRIYRP